MRMLLRRLSLLPLLALPAAAQSVASVNVNVNRVGEPTWKNYGSTIRDGQGNVTRLPMEVPFFRVASINTTVYVSLEATGTVTEKMVAKRVNGNTDLMVAAATGDAEGVRGLLAKPVLVNAKNMTGSTALMGASAGGYDEIVRLLLARGAQVGLKNAQGHTALMLAARYGHASTVDLLVQAKADAEATDSSGRTALMYAVYGGHEDVVKTLLGQGVRADYSDRTGITPAALAVQRAQTNLVVLLLRLPDSR